MRGGPALVELREAVPEHLPHARLPLHAADELLSLIIIIIIIIIIIVSIIIIINTNLILLICINQNDNNDHNNNNNDQHLDDGRRVRGRRDAVAGDVHVDVAPVVFVVLRLICFMCVYVFLICLFVLFM